MLQAQDGRYLQGNESLVDFTHPEDAVYLFGASDLNLSIEDDFGAKEPDHLVYIPTIEHEMYSFSAGYITLYDRFVKRGGFG